jgi:Purple acid Phosphatase, N-terminal domain/Fibronectin type III domain
MTKNGGFNLKRILKQKNNRKKKKNNKGFILPLSFNYGLKLSLVKIKRTFLNTRWKYITVGIITISFLTTSIFLNNFNQSRAATYNWSQASWSGGTSADVATHTSDQSSWNKYTSKDSNITVGDTVALTETETSQSETSDTHFNAGTASDTIVSGTGDDAGIELETAEDEDAFPDGVTPIYRSVGPSNTSDLNTNSRTVEISGSTVTFSDSMPSNMGVGDVLKYGGNLAFVHGRTSDTVYTVKTSSGGTPTAASSGTSVNVYRAYTSLSLAEAGTENTSIGVDFDSFSGGKNISSSNEVWNFACYNDAIDTTAVVVNGWTTDADNYIRIYTPYKTSEVGVTQRHDGKWSTSGYRLEIAGANNGIHEEAGYVRIDGLQISVDMGSAAGGGFYCVNTAGDRYLSNNIIKNIKSPNADPGTGTAGGHGFYLNNTISGVARVWNNIVYGFNLYGSGYGFIYVNANYDSVYIYNNTGYDVDMFKYGSGDGNNVLLKNNICQGASDGYGYVGCYYNNVASSSSAYNISSDTSYFGSNYKTEITVDFVDTNTNDFHLDVSDTAAKDAGVDLSADSNLSFSTDIDKDTRGASWDIGADEVNGTSFPTTGTFTSRPLDTTVNSVFGTMTWNSTNPNGTSITMKARSSNDSDMSGATDWSSCDSITNGSDISENNCVTDTDRYIQYQSTLNTSDTLVTPTLEDVTINYSYYGSNTSNSTIGFTTEENYTQEDSDGTDFDAGVVKINNTGIDSGTKLLLHMEGTDDAQVFTDSSASAHTITANAEAKTENTQKKFGDTSAYFDGTGDHLSVPNSSDFDFGSDPWSIDTWVYVPSSQSTFVIYDKRATNYSANGGIVISIVDDKLQFNASSGAEGWDIGADVVVATGFTNDVWHHVAVTWDGSVYRGFIDGVLGSTPLTSSTSITSTSDPVIIGSYALTWYHEGYVDEYRISKGTARWTENFTPATSPYGYPTTPYYITTTDNSQIDSSNWATIDSASITQTTPTNTNVKYLVSFDDRTTWKYWDGDSWEATTLDSLQTYGMSKTAIEGLSSANWASSGGFQARTTETIDFAMDLSTSDNTATPEIDSIQLSYHPYNHLLSSRFNAEASTNTLGGITWTEDATLPTGTTVVLSYKTASTSEGLSSADWTEVAESTPESLTTGCTKDSTTVTCGSSIIPAGMKDGTDDQFYQYRLGLSTDGSGTPTIDNIQPIYVVNGPPEIQTVTATQNENGTVDISYQAKDLDTTTGSTTPNYITPSFEYWNGSAWVACTTLASGDTDNKAVVEGEYTTYTATWTPTTDFNNQYLTDTVKIKVTVNDNEGANNTANAESSTFTLDTTSPTGTDIIVDATTEPATLTLAASDDSTLQMKVGLASDLAGSDWESYSASDTQTLADDPDTVYVQYKDQYGNESSIINATTPPTPNSIIIQDISNLNVSPATYSNFVTWGVVSEPTPGFTAYRVYHSTNGTDYYLEDSVIDRAQNYYADFSLTESSTHYYKVYVEDDDGNKSSYSDEVDGTANGVQDGDEGGGGVETTPPVISSVDSSSISTSSATIQWDTDELSNSTVEYITATGGDFSSASSQGVASMLNDSSGVGEHSVTLSGLSPDTDYYYQVKSTDISDNTQTDKDGTNGYTFTTDSGPTISNVTEGSIGNTGATITWTSNTDANSYVVYSTNSDLSSSTEVGTSDETDSHEVSLTGLTTNTKYYYYVKSGDGEDKNVVDGTIEYYSFTTSSDVSAPGITFDSSTGITVTDTTATINWATDESATAKIYYDTTANSYAEEEENTNYNYDHAVSLESLTPETTYYFKLENTDDNSNSISDDNSGSDYIFTTEASTSGDTSGPEISEVTVADLTYNSATITWETGEEGNSLVDYGETVSYGETYGNYSGTTTSHSVVVPGLNSLTKYYYRTRSNDSEGNTSTKAVDNNSTPLSFTTLSGSVDADDDGEGDQLTDVSGNVQDLIDSYDYSEEDIQASLANLYTITSDGPSATITNNTTATIAWDTSKSSLGKVTYWQDSNNEDTASTMSEEGDITTDHEIVIKKLNAQTKYKYYVTSVTPLGSTVTSDTKTFTTGDSPQISSISISDITLESAIIKWTTDSVTSSTVEYGTSNKYGKEQKSSSSSATTDHTVQLEGLSVGETYHLRITGTDSDDETVTSDDYTFTTQELPTISDTRVEDVNTEGVTIKWTTNVKTDSLVEYKIKEDEKGASQGVLEAVVDHEVKLEDLMPGATYEAKVFSKDQFGNKSESESFTFITEEDSNPPTIKAVKSETTIFPSKESKIQTIISWLTDKQSNSVIAYKEGTSAKDVDLTEALRNENVSEHEEWKILRKEELSFGHMFVITEFKPSTVYSFRVASLDKRGNLSVSDNYSLLTPAKDKSIFDLIIKNFEDTFGWLKKVGG